MMVIDNKFNIGEVVYLVTDPEAKPRIVYSLTINPKEIIYNVISGTESSPHFDFELTTNPANVLKQII